MSQFREITKLAAREIDRRKRAESYEKDPVLWAKDYLGIELWSAQREILYAIRDIRATAVAAGHGVGKSFVAAIACAWWVDVHPPHETFIASTAPTVDQVGILWDNIRRVHSIAQERFEQHIVDHMLPGYITGDHKWKLDDGTLLGQGRKPPSAMGDTAFQGRHATYLLAIGDEAVGLSQEFIDALGNIATGDYNRRLLLANPTDPSCAMAQIWLQEMEGWKRMHISVFDSPKITNEPGFDVAAAPALSGWEYIEQAKREYGEEDPRYIARVLGQWAMESGNNLFTAEELANGINTVVKPDPASGIIFGCDIARMGGDATFVYEYREGDIWDTNPETGEPTKMTDQRGGVVRKKDGWTKAPLVGKDPKNLGSAERIHNLALGVGAEVVSVDASGIGAGVIDGLAELNNGSYIVIEVFGGAPSSDKRAYVNMRAEQYFRLKTLLRDGKLDIDGSDEELLEELRGITYEYSDVGSIRMESKDSIKRRGGKSPDRADALWYACLDVNEILYGPQDGDVIVYDQDALLLQDAEVFYKMGADFGW